MNNKQNRKTDVRKRMCFDEKFACYKKAPVESVPIDTFLEAVNNIPERNLEIIWDSPYEYRVQYAFLGNDEYGENDEVRYQYDVRHSGGQLKSLSHPYNIRNFRQGDGDIIHEYLMIRMLIINPYDYGDDGGAPEEIWEDVSTEDEKKEYSDHLEYCRKILTREKRLMNKNREYVSLEVEDDEELDADNLLKQIQGGQTNNKEVK